MELRYTRLKAHGNLHSTIQLSSTINILSLKELIEKGGAYLRNLCRSDFARITVR
jgi:hypothetical protein